MASQTLRAFHGTTASHIESITEHGIRPSRNQDDWLGAGAYFFVDGLNDPRTSAYEWARTKLWDKRSRAFTDGQVAVIELEVTVDSDNLFDLREAKNVLEFHRARRRWLKLRVPPGSNHLERPLDPSYDTAVLDDFKRDNNIDALISDFYIQFFVGERHLRLDSRIPNVSILCLTHPLVGETAIQITHVDVLELTSTLESEFDE